MMSGTFGRTGTGSSNTTALASSLASKLQARTASGGSILYRLIWEESATPQGRLIYALRASGWTGGAAPRRNGWNGPYAFVPIPWLPAIWLPLPIGLIRLLASAASISGTASTLSGWPTPRTATGGPESAQRKKELGRMESGGGDLQAVALMSGWSTASARDWKDSENMSLIGTNPDGSERIRTDQLPRQAQLAGWPTAMAGTPAQNGNRPAGNSDSTRRTMALCGMEVVGSNLDLMDEWGPARITSESAILTGSFAAMENGGQLDPEHSRWLMRIPEGWASCAPTETASTLKRRRLSARS